MDPNRNQRLRSLPSIDELLARPRVQRLFEGYSRHAVKRAARVVVAEARRKILAGEEEGEVGDVSVEEALLRERASGLRRVINATGVILHTNLGRAPLPKAALEAIQRVCGGYSNLELDLETGKRGNRHAGLGSLLQELCATEAALGVNNNAGAVLLTLSALAQGKECIVSRGELVEIGGGFRIPDVMRQAGARLVEVGTTNRTRLSDYAAAVSGDTGLIAKIHPSNFAIVGFQEEASVQELASLAKERDIPLYVDLGSGYVRRVEGAPPEPSVVETLLAGADIVSFSGDKMLGGAQAGFIVGKRRWLERLESHPLLRALRMDKLAIAASEATLRLHRDGLEGEIPTMSMLCEDEARLMARAERLSRLLEERGISTSIRKTTAAVGGGSAPAAAPASVAVAVLGDASALQRELRMGDPPILARVESETLLLDARTLGEEELEEVARAVATAWRNVEGTYA